MAKYKKKVVRKLKQDKFRDTTMLFLDRVGDRLEGKGRTILYVIGGVVVIGAITGFFWRWSSRHADEARQALGRGITITTTSVSSTPAVGASSPSYSSEQERAQKAIEEFQKVVVKYGDPYRSQAKYFIATNELSLDRTKGIADLTDLTKSSNAEVSALAKFALAQALGMDAKYEEAARLYKDIVALNSEVITPETANLNLAKLYERQGKKKEAADILFSLVDTARKAKDSDGNPVTQSQAARDAAQELQKLDADRYAQLPAETPNLNF